MQHASFDKLLLAIVLILVAFGIVMVYSTSGLHGETLGSEHHFLVRHLLSILVGFAAMITVMFIPYELYRRPGVMYSFLALALALLIFTLIPGIGAKINNARRWLPLGTFRTFQPSEVTKLILVLYFSAYLVKKQEKVTSFSYTVLPCLIILGVFFSLIVIQPDLGTAMNVVMIVIPIMFIAGVRLSHLLGIGVVALPMIAMMAWNSPYQRLRIMMFLNPWQDPRHSGYQLIQSLIAIGKGGVAGVGLGQGQQKLFYLPEPYSDFIFSTVGEELGFIGGVILIILFGLLIWRGMVIAFNAPDLFGTFVAFGLTLLISVQAVINLGVVTGVFPTKGLPLPFISHGGTSLIVCLTSTGILLNISKYCEEFSWNLPPSAANQPVR